MDCKAGITTSPRNGESSIPIQKIGTGYLRHNEGLNIVAEIMFVPQHHSHIFFLINVKIRPIWYTSLIKMFIMRRFDTDSGTPKGFSSVVNFHTNTIGDIRRDIMHWNSVPPRYRR